MVMVNIRRFFSLGTAFAVLALFETIQLRPTAVVMAAVGALLLVAGIVKVFFKAAPDLSKKERLAYRLALAAVPLFLIWSALAFELLVERALARQALGLLVAALTALFFESMVMYEKNPSVFKGYSLENLGGYTATLAIFLGVSALLGMRLLLGLNIAFVAALFILLISLLTHSIFWFSGLRGSSASVTVWVVALLGFELFLVFNILPLYFMASGAILTVCWYVGVMLSRTQLLNLMTKKILYRHLGFGGALLAVLLLTAEWL
ncbi:hypothetical protein HYW17_01530 [Candidatus Uhrbacteria bacterium]|nr:hypothetical protein [Candidatus Uhrbacteria bacterium]